MIHKKELKKYIIIAIAAVLIIAGIILLIVLDRTPESYAYKYRDIDLSGDVGEITREGTYSSYLAEHEGAACPDKAVEIDLFSYTQATGVSVSDEQNLKGLFTDEESSVTWQLDVPEAGFYNLDFDYISVKSRNIDAERRLLINGELPFSNAEFISFTRLWTDGGRITADNQGNEIRPSQTEVLIPASTMAKDTLTGYENEPYRFYFEKGKNTLTLEGVSEPVIITGITVSPICEIPSYSDYYKNILSEHENILTSSQSDIWSQKVQGESSTLRSDPSLYPIFEHSSSNTDPYSISAVKLNAIGGNSWRVAGQWIEWEFEVPEDGFYNISFKGKQNFERGKAASRLLTIDGAVPFKEASDLRFEYSNSWNFSGINDGENDCKIYLTEGKHTVRLEVTLGDLGKSLGKLEDSSFRLNRIYRQILIVMGREPDKYRDYGITVVYPDMPDALKLEAARLYEIIDEIVEYSGGKSSKTGAILSLANLLEEMAAHPETMISRRLSTFRSYISALGTTIQSLSESKLNIDYMIVKTAFTDWPDDSENFFGKMGHEIASFFASFFTDYNSLGNIYTDTDDVLEVWILAGRDQSNVLKSMIDDSFTPDTGIKVNLKLVDSSAVLSAVVAGNGPDVLLSAAHTEPVNFAIRNAAIDLSQFDDFEEVASQFTESAILPFRYNGGVFALPETQTFSVLFYRKDILCELGLDVPETWEDFIAMISTLQQNNMEIGMPDVMGKGSTDLSAFYSIMYQNGVTLYNDKGYANLDKEEAIKAFEYYVQFYTKHDQPTDYTFVDRFRSGEMPIGLANFSLYNTLAVFAPELKGLWAFAPVPGTKQADGTVDHTGFSTGLSSMLIPGNDRMLDDGWTFLKWWMSTETQTRFGREMESILGAAGRYATANVEAFSQLAWSRSEMEVLQLQRSCTSANREVPGGYYTGRQIINAVRKTVNDSDVPRETLLDYNQQINDEIKKKREEFGLD